MEHFCRTCPPYERHKKYCLLLTCVSKEWFEKKMVHFSMILIVSIYSRLVMSCLKHTVTINQINSSVNHLSWFFIRKTYLFSQKMPFLFILWGYPHKKKHFFLKNFCFFCLQSRSYLLWWINVNKYSVTVITQQSEGFVMDHIDRCIVDILQHNARLPVKEIASRVSLSSPAVCARI